MQNSFSLLDKRIQSVLSELKFEATPIQEKSIPHILTGKNVLLIAPTGIGKTEAALLPVLHKFLEKPTQGIGILYITPLRALNRNMFDRITFWGEKLGFSFAVRHGDTTQNERTKQLKNPPQIMVTTPETVNLMLAAPKMSKNLENVKYVIIDEVHELVESKRGSQLALALERLKVKAGDFQRIGLSATVGDPSLVADFFKLENVIQAGLDRKIELSVEMPKFNKEDVELSNRLHISPDVVARLRRLKALIDTHGSVLTFVNTRSTAEVLSSRFEAWEGANKIGVHHSSLSKDVRVITENKFKEGEIKGLIATSSLELGIDIGHIDLVVQYSSPRQVNRLIQRVGRSGHNISKFPKGIVIANDVEDAIESAVIVRNAIDRKLEKPNIIEKPLDVLAHQLSGMAMENGTISILNAFKIVKNAYPYRNLDLDEFQSVLNQMVEERIIWIENGNFGKKQKTRLYYYLGVSMIADEAKFFVKDISTNRNIGVFDESFVINNLKAGGLVISHGKPWNIVDIGEREVLVEPAYDISGAIPAWEGEQIPVPFNVAQEVGKFKKAIASGKANYANYFIDSNSEDALDKYMGKQKEFFVPDDKTIVMETFDNFLFMYSHFGSKTNETIGKLLSILMSSYLGETVGMKSDPYRIIFEFVDAPRTDLVKKFIADTDLDQVKDILVRSMMRTHLFRYKFLHVAKRFGLMERERDYQRVSVTRLIEAVFDSPVYKETLNEIFTEKLDIEQAKIVLNWLKEGKIKLTEYKGTVSPFTEYAVSRVMRLPELVLPQRPESEIIDLMMQQTNMKIAKLYCTYCGSIFYDKIEDLPEKIKCPTCKSGMITYLKGKGDVKELYKKSKLSKEDKKAKEELDRIASLVSSYGKKAVIVMSGKGIGAETAVRVLGRMRKSDKEMFKDMLEAQKAFLKTKRYWN